MAAVDGVSTSDSSESCTLKYCGNNVVKNSYLVTFSNGTLQVPTRGVEFKAYESNETKDGLARRFTRKILVASSDAMDYVGYNFGPHGPRFGNLCKFYVGVLDKSSGKMKVHDAEFFHLQPHTSGFDNAESSTSDEKPEQSYSEKLDMLTSAFGSKRKKRAMESRVRSTIDNETLETVANNAEQDDETKINYLAVANEAEAIPPQNKHAELPNNVYKISDIITEEEGTFLAKEAAIFTNATEKEISSWKNEKKYSEYVLNYLSRPHAGKLSLDKAKLLLYYSYLMELYKLKWSDIRKKDPLPNVPNPCKRKILDAFTLQMTNESGRVYRTLPQRMKEKILAYALVLMLFLENFSVVMSKILTDFCITAGRLSSIAAALGCYVTAKRTPTETIKIVELKLPLFEKGGKLSAGKRGSVGRK